MNFDQEIVKVLSKLSRTERGAVYALAKQNMPDFIRFIRAMNQLETALKYGDKKLVEKIIKEHDYWAEYFSQLLEHDMILTSLKPNEQK